MKKYGNIKVVTVRQHRECCHCKSAIPNGYKVFDTKSKRSWYVKSVSLYNNVIEARAILDSTPFDDEGAAYANADFLSEAIGRWEQTQKGEDTFLDKRIEILGGSL